MWIIVAAERGKIQRNRLLSFCETFGEACHRLGFCHGSPRLPMRISAILVLAGTNSVAQLSVASPGLATTNAHAGAVGLAAKARNLEFPLITRSLDANSFHDVEATRKVLTWTNLITTNTASGDFLFTDSTTPSQVRRCYRGTVGQQPSLTLPAAGRRLRRAWPRMG
jgi:hypothetical protein